MSDEQPNPVGRPSVMTPEVIAKLEYAFALGCSDLEACFYADISKDALYNYQKDNDDFKERKEQLKERPVFLARESVVRDMETSGDLALKFLERKKKEEFGTKQDVNIGGQKDNPVIAKIERVIVDPANKDS